MKKPKAEITPLKLFVWENFAPDYTCGLAVAIARNETDAQAQIKECMGYNPSSWGTLTVHDLSHRKAFAVPGGG